MIGFADVAWPSRRSDLLVCFGVRHFALDRSSKSCFYFLHHDDEFAPTLVHVLQLKSSSQSGGLGLVCFAMLWSMPQLHNNTPCLKGHLSFGQYINCSCSFSCNTKRSNCPVQFML